MPAMSSPMRARDIASASCSAGVSSASATSMSMTQRRSCRWPSITTASRTVRTWRNMPWAAPLPATRSTR